MKRKAVEGEGEDKEKEKEGEENKGKDAKGKAEEPKPGNVPHKMETSPHVVSLLERGLSVTSKWQDNRLTLDGASPLQLFIREKCNNLKKTAVRDLSIQKALM